MMGTDVGKIVMLSEYAIQGISAPVTMVLAVFYLWQLLSFASLGGIFFIILSVPLTANITKRMGKLMMGLMKVKDDRVNCNQEVLTNMKTVKLQAWEDSFRSKTEDLRKLEIDQLWRYKIAGSIFGVVSSAIPMMVAVSSFGIYVTILGHSMDAATALTSISVFNLLSFPLGIFPFILNLGVEANVCLERIQKFLIAPNVERVRRLTDEDRNESAGDACVAIDIMNATFSYHGFSKNGDGSKKLSIRSKLGQKEEELLLAKAMLSDVEEHLAKLEGRTSCQYGTANTDGGLSDDFNDGFKNILPLRRISFKCNEGDFIAVVGEVGSGKTTLLKSILGEVQKVSGELGVRGTIAYFSQNPFIMNDTVKGNILFGKSSENIDHDLYKVAVKSACLEHDLKLLSAGDQTEIGEKGVNLSGGQKARVAIGRAVYRDADISLLDDCLSAVDAHVGRDLFDKCIVDVLLKDRIKRGRRKKRTVVLVTNALQYLSHPKVDRIVVLKDGLIAESGTYDTLVNTDGSVFRSMLDTFKDSMEQENDTDVDEDELIEEEILSDLLHDLNDLEHVEERRRSSILSRSSSSRRVTSRRSSSCRMSSRRSVEGPKIVGKGTTLTTSEAAESQIGKVEWKVYSAWAKAAGGVWVVIPLFLAFIAQQGLDFLQRFWLTQFWGTSGAKDMGSQLFYLSVYTLLYLTGIAVNFLKSIMPVLFGLKASKKFFSALLGSMLTAPMSFFDTTPTGRLVNRFSKDINTVDETLVSNFKNFAGAYYKQQHTYFSRSNRELKRIDSTSRSPIYSLFGEALNGYGTIRAFEAGPALSSRMSNFIDRQQHAYYLLR
ncbi:unnamed protein product [Pseudo-nitzschia multistriata]|uniref:ABC transmembrane type-1 domain-containing protein n=1 Tax=Pseudo-nitzschia multistriata TaxID=183589 RepID=A0A448ZSX5_9STRA|nr:unnamed protein product [Pseudo-nitzschia multistriata]